MEKLEYTLVTENSIEAFTESVNEKVSEGWEPRGEASTADTSHCDVKVEPIFAQLMRKRSE